MRRAQLGFTLLEVMVSMAIMAVLALLTAQTLRSGIMNRSFVTRELERDAQLADTIRIMKGDIARAFHYQNVFCKMESDMNSPGGAAGAPLVPGAPPPLTPPPVGAPGAVPGSTPKPCPPDYTGFIGSSDSLYFTSTSNVRVIRDSQESDQAKIGYFLKSCHSKNGKAGGTGQCLYRSISPFLDEDIDKPGPETLLLENVQELKFRYLGPDHDDLTSTWKTGKDGDDTTRDKFPYAVEITLTTEEVNPKASSSDKPRLTTVTALAPIYFENNPPKKKPDAGQTPGPTPPSNSPPPKT